MENYTYRQIELVNHTLNGWYGYGDTPEVLAGVEFVNIETDTLVKSVDGGVKSAIEVDRVLSVNPKFVTLALTIDLTQLWGLPAQPEQERSLGRVVASFDVGEPEDELTSWVTKDSLELIQNMLTCQRALEKLHADGTLVVNGEAIEPYFDMNSKVSRFRSIKREDALSLGLTPEEYPFSGGVRFAMVDGGFMFARVSVAFNPKTERHLMTIIGQEPEEGDTYDGKYGCVMMGLRAIGATTRARTGKGNILGGLKPSGVKPLKPADKAKETVPF